MTGMCSILLQMCLLMQSNLVAIGSTFVSTTIFVYPLTCVMLDIITEVYGYKTARKTLWSMVITNLIFGLIITLSTKVPHPSFWTRYDSYYDLAMSPLLKSTFVNLTAVLVGQFVNIYAISKLRILTRGRLFALRSMSSSIVGDTVTVTIALSIIFHSRMGGGNVFTIIRNELLFMYAGAIILSFPATLVNIFLKRAEKISNEFDFNPFYKLSKKNSEKQIS